jgi:hypothetical protein
MFYTHDSLNWPPGPLNRLVSFWLVAVGTVGSCFFFGGDPGRSSGTLRRRPPWTDHKHSSMAPPLGRVGAAPSWSLRCVKPCSQLPMLFLLCSLLHVHYCAHLVLAFGPLDKVLGWASVGRPDRKWVIHLKLLENGRPNRLFVNFESIRGEG